MGFNSAFKGLNAELNPICHLLALLGAHHILHVSRITEDGGDWLTSPPAVLPPPPPRGERTLVPVEYEAGWAPEPVWTVWRTEKFLAPYSVRTPDRPARSPVAIPTGLSRLLHYAVHGTSKQFVTTLKRCDLICSRTLSRDYFTAKFSLPFVLYFFHLPEPL